MIFLTVCNTCFQPYELSIDPGSTALVKELLDESETVACPRLCGGRILVSDSEAMAALAKDPRLKLPLRISAEELYKAVKGAGLPDEIPNAPEVVESLLLANAVIGVELASDGKHVGISELRLANKTIIHLTSGRLGAEVLKITRF